MLVICEDCAKKYHIDESRITASKARFPCKACGHIIVVEKPSSAAAPEVKKNEVPVSTPPPTAKAERRTAAEAAGFPAAVGGRGRPAALYLSAVMLVGLLAAGGAFSYLYFSYVPELVEHQLNLRGLALAIALKETVRTPLQEQNYLEVNQAVRQTAKLPGVAYAAVMNDKGAVIAGHFNSLSGFDSRFAQQVKEKGFPADIIAQSGLERKGVRLNMGGQPIHDRTLPLADFGGEIHVGIPVAEVDSEIHAALFSPLLFAPLGVGLMFAVIILLLVERLLTRPLRNLTSAANRISLGELDLPVALDGTRELRELATALKRMRHSIKIAVERIAARS
jgi:HAMP domain-containing protein